MSGPEQTTLLQIAQREFSAAKWCWRAALVLSAYALVAAVVAVLDPSKAGFAVAVVGVPLIGSWCKRIGAQYNARGQRARRWVWLEEGLGIRLSGAEFVAMNLAAPDLPQVDPTSVAPYFATTAEPGVVKFREMVAESGIYTSRIAATSCTICKFLVVVPLVVLIVAIARLADVQQGADMAIWGVVVRVAGMAASALLAGEATDLWLGFAEVERAAKRLVAEAEAQTTSGHIGPKLIDALAEYEVALAQTAPLPAPVYYLCRSSCEKDWVAFKSRPPRDEGGSSASG